MNKQAGMVAQIGTALNDLVSSPPAGIAGRRLASLSKISGALQQAPGKYQELAAKIAMASTRSHQEFQQVLGYAESLIDLNQSPVERDTNDLIMKLPQILNVVSDQSPAKADQLLRAVQSGNESEIGAIMSDLSRLKEAQGLIARGTGWGGKAATATDLQEWEAQIKNSGQNHTTRMRQLERLRKFGDGPVFEEKQDFIKQTIINKRNSNGKKVNNI